MNSIDSSVVQGWISKMAQQLRMQLGESLDDCLMIGIHSGGVRIANILHQQLGLTQPLGELNISFYRDDFSRIGLHPTVGASSLPFSVDDQTIILVDDVIYSGRTIRAAMNEIFDYGRPKKIILAALIEREGRELPIRADVIGQTMDLQHDDRVKLQKDDLSLAVSRVENAGGASE